MENRMNDGSAWARSEAPLKTLMDGIFNDVEVLFRQEIALATREFVDEARKAREVASAYATGAALVFCGLFFLGFMVVYLLEWSFGGAVPLWACFAIVGFVTTAVGACLILVARQRIKSINLIPEQTIASMKENIRWIRQRI